MIWIIVWFILGLFAAVIYVLHTLYVDKEDITVEFIPIAIILFVFGLITFCIVVVVASLVWYDSNKERIIVKGKKE